MNANFKFSFFSFLFISLLLFTSSFTIPKVKGKTNLLEIKRGAILDRNYEPISISMEFYKAYYLIRDDFFSKKFSPLVSKYLPSPLELPKKGLVLLKDKLDLKEVEILKNEENVFIESYYVRILLQPYMKFLIGEVANEYGISGLEKAFNEILKEGNWIRISLDMKLQRNLYNKLDKNRFLSAAVIDLKSGEFLAYWDLPENSHFTQYFPFSDFGISSKEIASFQWELGEIKPTYENLKVKITPLHLAKWFFNKACNNTYELTLLPRAPICEPSAEILSKLPLSFYFQDKLIYLAFKKDSLIILVTKIKEDPRVTLNYLKYLVQQV